VSHDQQSAGASDDRAASEVVASLVATTQALVRKEIELAKLELQRILVDKAIAVGAALVAALIALFVLAFVGVTAANALELVVAPWIAWAIVTGAYAIVAAGLLFAAYRYARRPVVPEQTKASVTDTITWAKQQVKTGPSGEASSEETT
jgi:protein-S-isoprenylcysteine O-methyltransferase Ste14